MYYILLYYNKESKGHFLGLTYLMKRYSHSKLNKKNKKT